MKTLTNKSDIPLALALWIAIDDYDYHDDPYYISATTLIRPVKQIILGDRARKQGMSTMNDVEDFVAVRLGSTIHDAIEKAWKNNHTRGLKRLGYPQDTIDRMVINPEGEVHPDHLPIYMEQREYKKIGKWTVGGKYDFISEGVLQDHKTASVWSWIYGSSDENHARQGSIYRWLNPAKITEDYMTVNFVFLDWNRKQALTTNNYPSSRLMSKRLELMSEKETDTYVRNKLSEIEKYWDADESEMPECTDEELWRGETTYKYYARPDAKRATKNFSSLVEANQFMASRGTGEIKTFLAEPVACLYCPAFKICQQRKRYYDDDGNYIE